jgi:ATP-dependent DNA helicase RecQ
MDLALFNFRKQRAEDRVEQAIRYAETHRCRSRLLLAYFDEPESPACGICDVCTGRHRNDLDAAAFEIYERKIRSVLIAEPLVIEEILQAFAPKRQDAVAQTIAYLLDEGKLTQDAAGKISIAG